MGINFYNTCIKHIYVMCICIAPKSINVSYKWYSKPNPTTFSISTTTAILESLP